MKRTRHEGFELRRILAAMVTDPIVCNRIASRWSDGGLFDSPQANLIGGWCVKHLRDYGLPPNSQLEGIFERWSKSTKADEAVIVGVESLLRQISREHEQNGEVNSKYILDLASRYVNRVKIKRLFEEGEGALDEDDVDGAYSKVSTFHRIELGSSDLVKPAEDWEAWDSAFNEEYQKQLIRYPGRLDRFLGREMIRENLISFMAPDKTGKSFWLLDCGFRGVMARKRVAYFDVGDHTQDQVMRRMGIRSAGRPMEAGQVKVPVSVNLEGELAYKLREFTGKLSAAKAFKTFKKLCKRNDSFRLSCHPNRSISVDGIAGVLHDWGRQGWVADIVIIDYADILAAQQSNIDVLQQIDDTWSSLRRLSQEMHCLVVTATQASAQAYRANATHLGRQHFSGRKTKLAHVTGMVGLNVTTKDKRKGITRVNWVVKREGWYAENRSLIVAGCLALANPAMKCAEG